MSSPSLSDVSAAAAQHARRHGAPATERARRAKATASCRASSCGSPRSPSRRGSDGGRRRTTLGDGDRAGDLMQPPGAHRQMAPRGEADHRVLAAHRDGHLSARLQTWRHRLPDRADRNRRHHRPRRGHLLPAHPRGTVRGAAGHGLAHREPQRAQLGTCSTGRARPPDPAARHRRDGPRPTTARTRRRRGRALGPRLDAHARLLLNATALAAIGTAAAGPIAFVALLSPQIARRWSAAARSGLPSAACGALLLVRRTSSPAGSSPPSSLSASSPPYSGPRTCCSRSPGRAASLSPMTDATAASGPPQLTR